MIKQYAFFLGVILLISCGPNEKKVEENETETHQHQHSSKELSEEELSSKKSIPRETHAMIGDLHLTIMYHSPGVRGRMVWGGLVPYDEVWVAGAHMATSFELSHDVSVMGNQLKAGKYAIFMIPGKDNWQVIFNSNWEQHLADDYDQALDLFRVSIEPIISEEPIERLAYSVETTNEKEASLVFEWEKIRIVVPFKVK
jgi:hypothetical protein